MFRLNDKAGLEAALASRGARQHAILGLDPLQVIVWLDLGDGAPAIQADFVWRAQRVVLEADGRAGFTGLSGPVSVTRG